MNKDHFKRRPACAPIRIPVEQYRFETQPACKSCLVVTIFLLVQLITLNVWADEYPKRIVSLAPSITEILFEVGAGDRVVAVTDFCRHPKKVKSLPSVGGLIKPSFETLISLKPDLVVLQDNRHRLQRNLEQMGFNILTVKLMTVSDILDAIKTIGKALGKESSAKEVVHSLEDQLARYKKLTQGVSKRSVLIYLGDSNAPTRDLYSVGKNTFLNEMLELAGGKNIVDSSLAQYPRLSKEFIIKASPEVILEANPDPNISKKALGHRQDFWSQFFTIKAVRDKRVHYVGKEFILLPGPRFMQIVEQFGHLIHPDVFPSSEDIHKTRMVRNP